MLIVNIYIDTPLIDQADTASLAESLVGKMVQPLHCSSPVKTVKFAEAESNLILLQGVSNSQPITNP